MAACSSLLRAAYIVTQNTDNLQPSASGPAFGVDFRLQTSEALNTSMGGSSQGSGANIENNSRLEDTNRCRGDLHNGHQYSSDGEKTNPKTRAVIH